MEIGKNVRYAIGGLALALLVSCNNAGSLDDTKIDSFPGTFKTPTSDTTLLVKYVVEKDSLGRPREIGVFHTDNKSSRTIARFRGASAESLYARLFPKVLDNYGLKETTPTK
ncbi:MAG TPA: hypothetical protein VJH95_03020 [Candidatus Nanoarchaeia archaeon]|nr:hypothetical protein [Candidatus Nanoarchaeia archaeon]